MSEEKTAPQEAPEEKPAQTPAESAAGRGEKLGGTVTTVLVSVLLSIAAVALMNRYAPQYIGVKMPAAQQKIAVLNMVEVAAEITRKTADPEAAAVAMGAAALYLAELQKENVVVLNGASVLASPDEIKITAEDFLSMSGVAQKIADDAKAKAGNAAPK